MIVNERRQLDLKQVKAVTNSVLKEEYSLGFVLVELVQVFTEFSNGVIVLLSESGHGLFVLNVSLFQVSP